jgi:hypothetical protein
VNDAKQREREPRRIVASTLVETKRLFVKVAE